MSFLIGLRQINDTLNLRVVANIDATHSETVLVQNINAAECHQQSIVEAFQLAKEQFERWERALFQWQREDHFIFTVPVDADSFDEINTHFETIISKAFPLAFPDWYVEHALDEAVELAQYSV